MRSKAFALVAIQFLLVSCEFSAPSKESDSAAVNSASKISDGRHEDGRPGFYWLPPILANPSSRGAFDPNFYPIVEICELSTSGCAVIKSYSREGGQSDPVRIETDHYHVDWKVGETALDPEKRYRIRVKVAGTMLGFADVNLAASGKDLKKVETGESISLNLNKTLPIRFRLEKGAVFPISGESGGEVTALDGKALLEIPPGAVPEAVDEVGITVVSAPAQNLSGIEAVPGTGFDFGPHGFRFDVPATLTIAYDEGNLSPGVSESNLHLYHELSLGNWVVVQRPRRDLAGNTISGSIPGFSRFAVAPPYADQIIFHSDRDGDYNIYRMNASGGAPTLLTSNPGIDANPDWSPVADRVAFTSKIGTCSDLFVMQGDGTGLTNLTNSPAILELESVWSPDGERLAYLKLGGDSLPSIAVIRKDGMEHVEIALGMHTYALPSWSPDGNFLTFSTFPQHDLYISHRDGTGLVRIAEGTQLRSVAWSPDGLKIAYVDERTLYTVNRDGTARTPLISGSIYLDDPRWSPDGSLLLYSKDDGSGPGIYTLNPSDMTEIELVTGFGYNTKPEWFSGGAKIAFYGGPEIDIFTMNANGTGRFNVTHDPAEDSWSTDIFLREPFECIDD